jgi:microcystin degradation protein MlrC
MGTNREHATILKPAGARNDEVRKIIANCPAPVFHRQNRGLYPMPTRKRLAIARLSHEGNSFTPVPTDLAAFRHREWTAGEAARALYAGTASEFGAAADFLAARADWEGVFLRCCAAPPGGPVEQAVLDAIRAEIVDGLSDGPWDGVYLSLHGALLGTEDSAPELRLLGDVRAVIGDAPFAVSFDLHANLDPAIADLADIVVGYKTYPHVDTYETGAKALALLERAVLGEIRPVSRIVPLGVVLPSFNMRTDVSAGAGPMAAVEAAARAAEGQPGVLDVTPFGGFAYADVAQAGASVSACADGDAALAEAAAREVLACFAEHTPRFAIRLPGPDEAIERALTLAPTGPVAVLEPADNPMSGGIGDTTGLFRALLAAKLSIPATFASFWDPDLVARAHAAGVGANLTCRLGGRVSSDYGAPVEADARVTRLTDGRFVNEGPMDRGLRTDLGPTVVLDVAGVSVIVTSTCQSPNDRAYFTLHGIDLARPGLMCVKAKNHFRAAFGAVFAALIDADTPGPAALDLAKLPYRTVPRERLLGAAD